MQITHVEVVPQELLLRLPYRTADGRLVDRAEAVFVRVETLQGAVAWGCTAFDPGRTSLTIGEVVSVCRNCADRLLDLNPLNTEYALAELSPLAEGLPLVLCAFDVALHDLLGLASGLPLHRLLGGYRDRIATSITVGIASVRDTVELAADRARQGFRILKFKGGRDAREDVERVRAVREALPHCTLRLDADQNYTVREAIEVARALKGFLEMLEQPVLADDLDGLQEVTRQSPVPILADESVAGPSSALEIAARRAAHGLSVKLAACGGIRCSRQVDAISRAARLDTMVGCINEPALLIAAGLGVALSSPNVRYGDLDGHFDLLGDPTVPGFRCEDGFLIASDAPGLGCTLET